MEHTLRLFTVVDSLAVITDEHMLLLLVCIERLFTVTFEVCQCFDHHTI